MFGYDFVNLDKAQKLQRRHLLDSYGLTAQYSAVTVLALSQVYFLLSWLCRNQLKADEELAPRSPHEKSFRRADGNWIYRGRQAWRVVRWWANDPLSPGWRTKGQWVIAFGWTSWLVFLCVHQTGNDYLHLTKRFGIVGASQLPLHYLLAMRSPWSPVRVLTRLTHEQLNAAHQILGRIITFLFCLHGAFYLYFFIISGLLAKRIQDRDVILGLISLVLFVFMSSTALGYLRTRNYRVFFAIHITLAPILPLALFWHVSHLRLYIWEVLGIYIIALMIRSRNINTYPGTISLIAGTNLVKIDMPLDAGSPVMNWNPGQHVYVSLPARSQAPSTIKVIIRQRYRTNPFTIASLPHEERRITLIARTLDGNTEKLASLARSLSDQTEDDKSTPNIDIMIEGPYGASFRLPDLSSYDQVLLIAGGVGATFIMPVFRSIAERRHWPSPAVASPRIRFIGRDAVTNVRPNVEVEIYVTQRKRDVLSGGEGEDVEMAEGVLLLSKEGETEKIGGNNTKYGRPDLRRVVGEAFAQPSGKVAVLVCGPKKMTEEARGLVGRWVRKGRDVYCHAETFGL